MKSKYVLSATKNEFHTIEDGKQCTIRKGYRDIRLGPIVIILMDGNETLTVNVTQVIHCKVIDLPLEYVKRDEFMDRHDLVHQLKQYYVDIDEHTEITAIVFTQILTMESKFKNTKI